jgi:hypothetical protein
MKTYENIKICVFCESACQPPPTKDGWIDLNIKYGIHYRCVDSLAELANAIRNARVINKERNQ